MESEGWKQAKYLMDRGHLSGYLINTCCIIDAGLTCALQGRTLTDGCFSDCRCHRMYSNVFGMFAAAGGHLICRRELGADHRVIHVSLFLGWVGLFSTLFK